MTIEENIQSLQADIKRLRQENEELRGLCGDLAGMAATLSGASDDDRALMAEGVKESILPVNIDKDEKDYIEDGFGSAWGSKCLQCGGKMEVVRPGKAQCSRCG